MNNTSTISDSQRYYDPNSTSEENRRMIRDEMVRQGTNAVDADVFTRELYNAEREHRRKHSLPQSDSQRYYDPNSTSEENRRMIRDEMIRQGTNAVDADVFTRELYNAEREHRRKRGLPQ